MNEDNKNIKKPSLWQLLYPLLIFYGAGIIASIVFGVIFSFLSVRQLGILSVTESNYEQLLSALENYLVEYSQYINILQDALVIAAAAYFMKRDNKALKESGVAISYEKPAIIFFALAFILGIAASITGNNLLSISGISTYFEDELQSVNESIYNGGMVINIILVGILAPVAEELVYRGLFFKRLRERNGKVFAIIVSSLIFGFIHGNVPQGIYTFLLGLILAYSMEKFKTVIAPILIHVGANIFSVIGTRTRLLDFLNNNNNTAIIAYVVIPAVLVAVLLWIVYNKVEPKEISK